MPVAEDPNDPDNVNAYFDQVRDWSEEASPNVVPFRKSTAIARASSDLPVITLVAGELHNIATEAETALIAADTPFYVRGEQLVRPVTDDLPASHGRRTKVARLSDVGEAVMIDRLSRSALWTKWDARAKKYVPADPTPKVAATVLARDGEWRFRKLTGVITTPTLRPDGTILSEPGYDPATQLLLLDPPAMPELPPRPTKKHAANALKFLDALLSEFPFVDAASHSVALSALITPVVRGAISVTPMHATTAPVPGSGKSYIIDLASAINSGERAPVLTAGRNEEETEKRLVAALLSGQTIISIDNVNGQLGGDALCQIIERPVVAVRPLGQSTFTKVESRASCFATGNNIQLVGDMTRRVLLCSLDPDVERPELRVFHSNPFDAVLADRGKYVAAALIVVRAYVVAGCPGVLPPLASFEDWSRMVRSALVWLGRPDPCDTMNKARAEDPITSSLTNLFTSWHVAAGSAPQTVGAIKDIASLNDSFGRLLHGNLREALVDVADDGRGGVNSKKLGNFLKRYEGRIIAGLKLISEEDSHSKQKVWKVSKS
jgi:putative DNA primase/helicase